MPAMTTKGVPEHDPAIFSDRRERVLNALGDGVMVLPAAPVQHSSRDTERPYHPDRELYYVTGVTEPQSLAILVGGDEPRFVLFVRDRDPDAELWAGGRLGVEGAKERFSPDECHPIVALRERLPELLQASRSLYYRLGASETIEAFVRGALTHARARGARRGTGPRSVADPGEILDRMRAIKDDAEIGRIREAVEVSIAGHRAGAAVIAPGVGEWAVEAAIDAAFRKAGARGPGFETIVGSGPNTCVLHYVENGASIEDGDLVLVDAGAEVDFYHGDITRTYPASGRFDGRQRAVYEVVEAARAAAVDTVAPHRTIGEVHEAAVRVLVEGLIALDALDGSVEELIETEAYKPYFPHQTSHWLGLDVHDPGDYAIGDASRKLLAGMVFTVEPGLYFRPGVEGVDAPEFERIGVRIEDDVLVTADGCDVLTEALPTKPDDVEAMVGAAD